VSKETKIKISKASVRPIVADGTMYESIKLAVTQIGCSKSTVHARLKRGVYRYATQEEIEQGKVLDPKILEIDFW
jgi:hypothetical protein